MNRSSRRGFLSDVGRGMLIASVGSALAADLGTSSAWAEDGAEALTFGPLEPLVVLMQETPPDKLMPLLVERLRAGTELRELVAAAALANARTFGGEDYVGFHTMMAMTPAWQMSRELPAQRQALPVLKVLYRNTSRIQAHGGRASEVLHPVAAAEAAGGQNGNDLRDAVRRTDLEGAERMFAAFSLEGPEDSFNHLLHMVQDGHEVHRVALPYRAWSLIELVGPEHAHTLLRQSIRYCVESERKPRIVEYFSNSREIIPRLLDQYHLMDAMAGSREAEDGWIDETSRAIFAATPEQAAETVAAALADGMSPNAVGEAISLAANQLILRDVGRLAAHAQPNKPAGSVHGDSIGVHACDSANAWRNMARVGNNRNRAVCLMLAGYQMAQDRDHGARDFLNWQPWPTSEALSKTTATDPATLLAEADAAIAANDQAQATALIHRYGELGHEPRAAFDLLLRHSTAQDGALHAEKYYRTVCEEYAATRPAFRWRQVTALARVVASGHGQAAPGFAQACELLGV